MASLILEGGSFRTIFSAGVLDGLMEHDMFFPYVIGVSGGISMGASYISKQNGRNLTVLKQYRNDNKYTGIGNLFTDRSLFGVQFVFETIPQKLVPFDYATYYRYPGKVIAVVTNAITGLPEYLDALNTSISNEVYKATCSIPALFEPQQIDTNLYYDGGVSDSIPILKAINDGNEKHLIVLTQPEGYVKEIDLQTKVASAMVSGRFPMVGYKLRHRSDLYNLQLQLCEKLEKENKAVIIRPQNAIKSEESDIEILEATYNEGKKWVYDNIDKLKDFFKDELIK